MFGQVNTSPSVPTPRSSTRYRLSHNLSYSHVYFTHSAFLDNTTAHKEPQPYDQTVHDPQWQEAMNIKLEALKQNNKCSLIPLPLGHNPIGCK